MSITRDVKENKDKTKGRNLLRPFLFVLVAVVVALATVLNPFYGFDTFFSDKLYTKLTGPRPDIVVIGVDEETLDAYGNFLTWSREKNADLINYLMADEENAPAVIALDFMYVDETDPVADAALAKASADAGNVVFATNLVYRGQLGTDENGEMYYDNYNISNVEEPYDALKESAIQGFSNVCIGEDGCVRYGMNTAHVGGDAKELDSFAYAIYKEYASKHGIEPVRPKENKAGQFMFFYSGECGEYSHFSMKRVLDGEIPPQAFKDAIVVVGAYAPGFQDSYKPSIDRGSVMYGCEIHANIVQSYLEGKTALPMNVVLMFVIVFAASFLLLLVMSKSKIAPAVIESLVFAAGMSFLGRWLASSQGKFMPIVYFYIFVLLADAYVVIEKYFLEKIRRRKTLEVFKKYVSPQVVEDLTTKGNFELKLGGEKRNIACMFVDIRGFTPLSESLEPEQVVSILNEYLTLTTSCVFKHNGTLDKFIGDATMAVFNAPFDQEDYLYEAVATAWDIKEGADELGERLLKKFDRKVGFGIGVNCGPAVVGNIGCDFRMDYTAIGDTVNTAARLESNAAANQILISEQVYSALKKRIKANPVGEIPLKGKSIKIMVYEVTDITC